MRRMQDVEAFRQLLGLTPPWEVTRVVSHCISPRFEDLRLLWTMPSLAEGKRYLDNLRHRAMRMKLRLVLVLKVAQMLKDHEPEVLNYFRYRVTNAAAESINAILDRVQRRAAGFRSFASMRLAVLFHCGGLDLYPALSGATPGKV